MSRIFINISGVFFRHSHLEICNLFVFLNQVLVITKQMEGFKRQKISVQTKFTMCESQKQIFLLSSNYLLSFF